jgi:hypothetical protein
LQVRVMEGEIYGIEWLAVDVEFESLLICYDLKSHII